MRKSHRIGLLLVTGVFALCLFHQDAVAQCAGDPNDIAPASVCPAAIPVPVGPAPLPPAAACPINDLTFTTYLAGADLDWTCPAGCLACPSPGYDVVRGSVNCLRASHNLVSDTCVDGIPAACPGGIAAPPFGSLDIDANPPIIVVGTERLASAYWYLVRVNPPLCGGSTWNSIGMRQLSDYDPTCPACMGCPPGCPP